MAFQEFSSYRLVKSEDLNHHGTLFAGRCAEWFAESGFIPACRMLSPSSLVCLRIHGMTFIQPARVGQTVRYSAKIVHAGKTSLTAFISVTMNDGKELMVEGFVTYVHVDSATHPIPHKLTVEPSDAEEKKLMETAAKLIKLRIY